MNIIAVIFLISFISIAIIYAVISSSTKILYKNKPIDSLSLCEINILRGKSKLSERITLFFINLFSSIIFPPIYILSLLITLIFYILYIFL